MEFEFQLIGIVLLKCHCLYEILYVTIKNFSTIVGKFRNLYWYVCGFEYLLIGIASSCYTIYKNINSFYKELD